MKEHLLVTLADRNFLDQAKQLFSSVYWNAGWKGDYMLLAHEDVPEEGLRWFREKGILVYRCEALSGWECAGAWGHPSAVLDKFYIFTPYFKQWKHVVYLDGDIIVRASLDRLLNVKGFAAPNAHATPLRKEFVKCTRENRSLFRELKREYPLKGIAFNSGIMAINTDIIENDTFEKITALYRRFGSLNKYGEEGTLNLFFYKKWELLSFLFNIYPFFAHKIYGVPYEKIDGIALHFVRGSIIKPWLEASLFYKEWKRNLEKAEEIDLSKIPEGREMWPPEAEDKDYLLSLPARKFIGFYRRAFHAIDWMIGQIGILVKKLSPALYERIRIKK